MKLSPIAICSLAILPALAGCALVSDQVTIPDDIVASCLEEASIQGVPVMTTRNEGYGDIPQVVASQDVSSIQADAANSCLNLYAGNAYTAMVNNRANLMGGNLILPSGYPLLPGDLDLWLTLTPEQQARALVFLRDGSTIRSSLLSD